MHPHPLALQANRGCGTIVSRPFHLGRVSARISLINHNQGRFSTGITNISEFDQHLQPQAIVMMGEFFNLLVMRENALMIFTRSILFVCLMSGEIRAQYHTESWTTSNGLPQNSVLAILQTRDGYIWLTTNDGLLRFDGVKFTIFDSTNSPGLCCNRLTSLSEDSEGALWIGTDENKLVKYQNRRFTTFPTNGAYSIKKDRSGNFSITAYERHEFSSVHRAPALHFPDRSGADWYSDDRWLIRFKDGQQTVYQFPTNVKHTETIYEDEKGVLWIGTRMGLWRLQNGNLSRVAVDDKQPELAVTAIIEDNDGDFWIGTSKGLYQEQAGKFKVFDSTQGLANAFIRALYVDREELLWIGTDTKGLFKLQRTVITTYSQRDGLATDNVYPLFQDSRGRIWIGSWPRGITIYQNGKFERVKTLQSMSYKFPFAFYEDREGTILIASGPGWCFKNGRAVDWPSQLSLQVYCTSAIIQDRSGAMWFGAENGLFRFFQGEITRYTKKDRLVDGEINVLLEDRQGAIWIGARNGLSRLSNARFTNYTVNNGLKSNHIRSLYEDEDGTIWVGTFDGGLSRIKDEKITTYMPHDGLFSKGAFQILDDDQGNLWLSSNLGIYRVSKSQLNAFADGKVNSIVSIPYGQRDGMRIPECNGGRQPAGFKSRDGKLWFPTVGGIAVVDVSKALARPLPSPLIIDRIEVADKMLNSEEALLIDFDENSLKIYYNCLSFMKPDAVNFRYIMEGLDRNCVDAGNRRIAPYPYLPPGRFRFRLAASIAGGEWNEFEKSIRITVPTPFWRSWWFVSLIILAVAIAGYFYYRGPVSTLVKRNA